MKRPGRLVRKRGIRPFSKKRSLQNGQYSDLRKMWMESHRTCERCGGPTEEIHHRKGRRGTLLLATRWWMAVCKVCHAYIHANPAESYERGWMLHRDMSAKREKERVQEGPGGN